jgi:deazaflavin-dependent oxidoreductase (nitroreductase family)
VFGVLVGTGMAPSDYYLLQVRGRRTGRQFSTPVNVVHVAGRQYLVAPRGMTQWVRNAEAAGRLILKRGRSRQEFEIRAVPAGERPEILCAYLDRFRTTVQRYFPVRAGSAAAEFTALAGQYPVFELLEPGRPS